MFRVTLIVYLRCKTHFFHACMLLCLSECDKISRWPVLPFKVRIYTTLNIMYQRKYFCINIKFPNVLDSKHIFPYWFKYICKKPTFSGFLYKKLVFSLPKNVTKSAVRNFLSAFGAPGEFIISLLLPGGLSYLFKIRFLIFSPFCQVTRSALWSRIFFKLSFTSPKLLLRFFVLLDGCACPARSGCFGRFTEPWPWPASTRRTGYPKPWSASCRSTSCWSSARGTGFVPILFIALVLAVFLRVARRRFSACSVSLRSTLLVLPHSSLFFCPFQFVSFRVVLVWSLCITGF